MAHSKEWQAWKTEFRDEELYYVIHARYEGSSGLDCAKALGREYGAVYGIYRSRGPYLSQVVRVGRPVQSDRVESPRCTRRQAAAALFAEAVTA
jgi:hypothetical protein